MQRRFGLPLVSKCKLQKKRKGKKKERNLNFTGGCSKGREGRAQRGAVVTAQIKARDEGRGVGCGGWGIPEVDSESTRNTGLLCVAEPRLGKQLIYKNRRKNLKATHLA